MMRYWLIGSSSEVSWGIHWSSQAFLTAWTSVPVSLVFL